MDVLDVTYPSLRDTVYDISGEYRQPFSSQIRYGKHASSSGLLNFFVVVQAVPGRGNEQDVEVWSSPHCWCYVPGGQWDYLGRNEEKFERVTIKNEVGSRKIISMEL